MKDWNDFLAVAQGKEPGTKQTPTPRTSISRQQPGYTGTAHALLQGGVPSVVAMRYAVGDDYARELAVEFYRALLAHTQPKNVAAALTWRGSALLDGKKHDLARFAVCDHATPVLYGEEQPGLTLAKGPQPGLDAAQPAPAPDRRADHRRGTRTSSGAPGNWPGWGRTSSAPAAGAEVKPVAVITGLGGMGKTALVAEALELWETRFEWVLLYQAKPNPLGFDATLRDIHLKLMGELGATTTTCGPIPPMPSTATPAPSSPAPRGWTRLTRNLVRALKDEPILLVLDNFETNLKPAAPELRRRPRLAEPVWACQDPAWDQCLAPLAQRTGGSPSRVLITCRRPLAALAMG